MQKLSVLIMVACLSFSVCAQELSTDLNIEVSSAWAWRGKVITEDFVAQPSLTFEDSNLMLILWGNWAIEEEDGAPDITRNDITIDYTHFGKQTMLSVGGKAYLLPDDPTNPQDDIYEIYLSCVVDVLTLPSLTMYYDVDELESMYATFRIGHSYSFGNKYMLDLEAGVNAGSALYCDNNFSYWANSDSGYEGYVPEQAKLIDATASISLPIILDQNTLLTPSVEYMTLMDSELKDQAVINDEKYDLLMYSISLRTTF